MKNPMSIMGEPVEVHLGIDDSKIYYAYPTKLKDYQDFYSGLGIMSLEKFEFHEMLEKSIKENVFPKEINDFHQEMINNDIGVFESLRFLQIYKISTPIVNSVLVGMYDFFKLVFKDETALDSVVTPEQFEKCKEIIRDLNGVKYKKPSPNPEIRYYDELKAKSEELKYGKITFEAIYTSIIVEVGYTPEQVNELTIKQFMSIFDRIKSFKAYDATTMYAIMGDVEIHQWYAESDKEKKRKTLSNNDLKHGSKNL